jgi:hypothetical protein
MKEFMEWLSRIDVSYESLPRVERMKLKQVYDQSRPTSKGMFWQWFPFWSRSSKEKQE